MVMLQSWSNGECGIPYTLNHLTEGKQMSSVPVKILSTTYLFANIYIYIYIYIYIFTNPSARAGYDIRSIFKRSLTGLNSEFSFS